MSIRLANIDDVLAIGRVHNASREAIYPRQLGAGIFERLTDEQRAERWRAILTDGKSTTLLAVEAERHHEPGDEPGGERFLGFAVYVPSRDEDAAHSPAYGPAPVGEIISLYVDPPAWRRGVGAALMEAALDGLAAAGFGDVTLWVLQENGQAQSFYARFGFAPDGGRAQSGLDKSVPIHRWRRPALWLHPRPIVAVKNDAEATRPSTRSPRSPQGTI